MKKIFCLILLASFSLQGLAQSMVPKAPKLNLDSYILLEASTNTVIAEFNSDNQISPASMTKVMSGYVIADQIATGAISSTVMLTLSPGITISVPEGSVAAPVTSVVRK